MQGLSNQMDLLPASVLIIVDVFNIEHFHSTLRKQNTKYSYLKKYNL